EGCGEGDAARAVAGVRVEVEQVRPPDGDGGPGGDHAGFAAAQQDALPGALPRFGVSLDAWVELREEVEHAARPGGQVARVQGWGEALAPRCEGLGEAEFGGDGVGG